MKNFVARILMCVSLLPAQFANAGQSSAAEINSQIRQTSKRGTRVFDSQGYQFVDQNGVALNTADYLRNILSADVNEIRVRVPAERSPSNKAFTLSYRVSTISDTHIRVIAAAYNDKSEIITRTSGLVNLSDYQQTQVTLNQLAKNFGDGVKQFQVSKASQIMNILFPKAYAVEVSPVLMIGLINLGFGLALKSKPLITVGTMFTFIGAVTTLTTR